MAFFFDFTHHTHTHHHQEMFLGVIRQHVLLVRIYMFGKVFSISLRPLLRHIHQTWYSTLNSCLNHLRPKNSRYVSSLLRQIATCQWLEWKIPYSTLCNSLQYTNNAIIYDKCGPNSTCLKMISIFNRIRIKNAQAYYTNTKAYKECLE